MPSKKRKPSTAYLTISEIKRELIKRNIKIPSWYKRTTLLALLNRNNVQQVPDFHLTRGSGHHVPRSRTRPNSRDLVPAVQSEERREHAPGYAPRPLGHSVTMDASSQPRSEDNIDQRPNAVQGSENGSGSASKASDSVLQSVLSELSALKKSVSALTEDRELAQMSGDTSGRRDLQGAALSSEAGNNNIRFGMSVSPQMSQSYIQSQIGTHNFGGGTGYTLQTAMGSPMSTMPGIPGYNNSLDLSALHPPSSSATNRQHDSLNNVTDNAQNYDMRRQGQPCNVRSSSRPICTSTGNDITQSISSLISNNNDFPPSTGNRLNLLSRSDGVPSDTLPHIDIVTPSVRRDIIMGKDINLSGLLIPGFKTDSTIDRHLIKGNEVIALKSASDTRLGRNLSISEFIMAFTTFKHIMCEAYPQRQSELDNYQRNMVEMAHTFGGTIYYDYHRAFSARAAAMLQNYNIKIDWAIKDTNLFCMTFAGHTSLSCSHCASKMHTSQFCPHIGDAISTKASHGHIVGRARNRGADGRGRPIVRIDGREVCNNFNGDLGCYRWDCGYLHACALCKKGNHGASRCNSKAPTNGLNKGQITPAITSSKFIRATTTKPMT